MKIVFKSNSRRLLYTGCTPPHGTSAGKFESDLNRQWWDNNTICISTVAADLLVAAASATCCCRCHDHTAGWPPVQSLPLTTTGKYCVLYSLGGASSSSFRGYECTPYVYIIIVYVVVMRILNVIVCSLFFPTQARTTVFCLWSPLESRPRRVYHTVILLLSCCCIIATPYYMLRYRVCYARARGRLGNGRRRLRDTAAASREYIFVNNCPPPLLFWRSS